MSINYKIWPFYIVFNYFELTEKELDKLYEAGCDDVSILQIGTQTILQFNRSGFTLYEVIQGVLQDIKAANLEAEIDHIKIYPEELE